MENPTLKTLLDLKKKQLRCSTPRKMFQRIPAQFCDMVSRIGFHAEYAPPDGMITLLQIEFDNMQINSLRLVNDHNFQGVE